MSFIEWLKCYGRIVYGSKAHLIELAKIINLPNETLLAMEEMGDMECEQLLIDKIEGKIGGQVDWRARFAEVLDTILPALDEREKTALTNISAPLMPLMDPGSTEPGVLANEDSDADASSNFNNPVFLN